MTFDLTPGQEARVLAIRERAARAVAPQAGNIDTSGILPDEVRAEIEALKVWASSPLEAVLALEELAVVSGAAAAWAALGLRDSSRPSSLAGLRGVPVVAEPTDQQRLGLAAVAVGLGRAAVAEAVSVARARGDRPGGDPVDPPHWTLAEAATEIEAARLVVRAAATGDLAGAPAALVFAGVAAVRAVEAALRVVGAPGFHSGAALERTGRDARAVLLVAGTEDAVRVVAADRLIDR